MVERAVLFDIFDVVVLFLVEFAPSWHCKPGAYVWDSRTSVCCHGETPWWHAGDDPVQWEEQTSRAQHQVSGHTGLQMLSFFSYPFKSNFSVVLFWSAFCLDEAVIWMSSRAKLERRVCGLIRAVGPLGAAGAHPLAMDLKPQSCCHVVKMLLSAVSGASASMKVNGNIEWLWFHPDSQWLCFGLNIERNEHCCCYCCLFYTLYNPTVIIKHSYSTFKSLGSVRSVHVFEKCFFLLI